MRLRREEGPQACRGPAGREGGSQWDGTDRGCRRRASEMGDLMRGTWKTLTAPSWGFRGSVAWG